MWPQPFHIRPQSNESQQTSRFLPVFPSSFKAVSIARADTFLIINTVLCCRCISTAKTRRQLYQLLVFVCTNDSIVQTDLNIDSLNDYTWRWCVFLFLISSISSKMMDVQQKYWAIIAMDATAVQDFNIFKAKLQRIQQDYLRFCW